MDLQMAEHGIRHLADHQTCERAGGRLEDDDGNHPNRDERCGQE
jgi:hypothetical protein